jgi:hypothetical protein
MQLFLSDLWADLREKRLWPVAAALLAVLIAVPLVVAKPAAEPPPAVAPTAERSQLPDAGLKVLAAEDSTGRGSDLGVFDPKDPFKPPAKFTANEDAAASGPASATAGPSSDAGSSAGGSAGGGKAADGGSQGGSGGGSQGGSGGGGGGNPGTPTTKTERFTYVLDVTYAHNGRTRRVRGMQRLDMLPNQSSPLLIFLGVDPKGNNAVFLVDSKLKGAGEGNCKPSETDCAFLSIGAGSEHEFTAEDGNTYGLRIDQIRRVKLGAASAKGSAKRKPAKKKAKGSSQETRRFTPPVLLDLISVASSDGGNSNKSTKDR